MVKISPISRIKRVLSRLEGSGCQYALYFKAGQPLPLFYANHEVFLSASLIKLPILLAWVMLERQGEIRRDALCCLDDEDQVQGAGLSWLFNTRQLPYHDVLLMMIALSDNLCTNLVIRQIGLARLERVIRDDLGLRGTHLQRRLMDYTARAEGKENRISAADCIRLFDLFHALHPAERAWVEPMLANNQDSGLLGRDIPRDTLTFYHKIGSITGLLHDWGYTEGADIFLLTQDVKDEIAVTRLFGEFGRVLTA